MVRKKTEACRRQLSDIGQGQFADHQGLGHRGESLEAAVEPGDHRCWRDVEQDVIADVGD